MRGFGIEHCLDIFRRVINSLQDVALSLKSDMTGRAVRVLADLHDQVINFVLKGQF